MIYDSRTNMSKYVLFILLKVALIQHCYNINYDFNYKSCLISYLATQAIFWNVWNYVGISYTFFHYYYYYIIILLGAQNV